MEMSKIVSVRDVENNLEEKLAALQSVFNTILQIEEVTFEETLNLIQKQEKNIPCIIIFIQHAILIRPRKVILLLDLIKILIQKYGYEAGVINPYVSKLLIEAEIIKYDPIFEEKHNHYYYGGLEKDIMNKEEELEEGRVDKLINVYPKGSIEEAIKNDDISSFINMITDTDFDPNSFICKKPSTKLTPIFYVKNEKKISYYELMAFYGSVKCIKYILLNGICDFSKAAPYAIASGNIEVIKLLEKRKVSFDNCFNTSLMFYRNNIADWLLNNYKCEIPEKSIKYNQISAIFPIVNKWKNDEKYYESVIHSAISNKNFVLARHFMDYIDIKPYLNNYALEASYQRNYEGLKFLIEEFHADYNTYDAFKRTLLNLAVYSNSMMIIKYLVEKCHLNINDKDIESETPVTMACKRGNFEIIKYFVEKCNATISDDSYQYLTYQIESEGLQPLQLIIEKFHPDINYLYFEGYSAIYYAITRKNCELLKYLLSKYKVDLNKSISKSRFDIPLILACKYKDMNIIKYLIEECHADVNVTVEATKYNDEKSPFSVALENEDTELINYLVNDCHVDTERIPTKRIAQSGNPFMAFDTKFVLVDYEFNEEDNTLKEVMHFD